MLRVIFDPIDHPGAMSPERIWFAAELIHRLDMRTGDTFAKYPQSRVWNPRTHLVRS